MMEHTNAQSLKLGKQQLWVAIAALVVALLSAWNTYTLGKQGRAIGKQGETLRAVQEQQNRIQVAIKDTEGLRAALSKPLEGVWSFKTHYTKFHEEEGDWESFGKAIFRWRPKDSKYEMFMATTIIRRGEIGKSLVTLYADGLITADPTGVPVEPFEIEMEYNGRTGLPPYDNPSYKTFSYTNCTLVKDENGRPNKILTQFLSYKSEGEAIFTLEKQ